MKFQTLVSAAALALSFALPAQAAVVTRTLGWTVVPYLSTYVDIDGDGTDDLRFTVEYGMGRIYGPTYGSPLTSAVSSTADGRLRRLDVGDALDSNVNFGSLAMGTFMSQDAGDWGSADASGFIGLMFDIGGMAHYGYAEVQKSNGEFRFLSVGYETVAGQSITAGASAAADVPEPTSLALVGIAAVAGIGIGAGRRRRKG